MNLIIPTFGPFVPQFMKFHGLLTLYPRFMIEVYEP